MNFTTTIGAAAFRKPLRKGFARALRAASVRCQRLLQAPLLLWLLVMAAALLTFFVHLLNEQVLRGQLLREEQRAGATRTAPQAAGNVLQSGNQLLVTRQPMTRP